MGMKKIYTCNICRDTIENPNQSFGVNFSNLTNFTFGGHGSTDGIHICYRCARQLKECLNNEEINKLINEVAK